VGLKFNLLALLKKYGSFKKLKKARKARLRILKPMAWVS
jgi:hypothetical protein